jgi:hypothetical protein
MAFEPILIIMDWVLFCTGFSSIACSMFINDLIEKGFYSAFFLKMGIYLIKEIISQAMNRIGGYLSRRAFTC